MIFVFITLYDVITTCITHNYYSMPMLTYWWIYIIEMFCVHTSLVEVSYDAVNNNFMG
jgi:hypothetical protein